MGYNTRYSLKIYPSSYPITEIIDDLISLRKYTPFTADGPTGGWTWHERDEDMSFLSRKHGDVLLVLTGRGDDPGDVWRKAYMNGAIVWKWKMNDSIPDPPEELIQQAIHKRAQVLKKRDEQRIAELEAELARLKSKASTQETS